MSGKSQGKQKFFQVRELSGNFEKMLGKFGFLTNVRELSEFSHDNYFFSKNDLHSHLFAYFLKS